jgi:hypothetical protein
MARVQTSVSPYYNDYDESKNFHQILFRPGIGVQARELTQVQDIFQNQLSKVGNNLFREGSMVIPGNTAYDLSVKYAKINPQFNGSSVDITLLENVLLKGSVSGVTVRVVKAATATSLETWNTLVYKVVANGGATGLNSTLFDNEILSGDDGAGNYTVQKCQTIISNSSGNSSVAFINDGTYYVRGRFVNVYKQTVILSQYSKTPSSRVGLRVNEEIITENDADVGNTLLDPAFGSSNYNAPGAHRLKTSLTLETIGYNDNPGIDFIQLLVFSNGVLQQIVDRTVYNVIGDAMASRTYEESGHYVVHDINPKIKEHLAIYDTVDSNLNLNGGLYRAVEYTATASVVNGSNIITDISTLTGSIVEGHTIYESSASVGSYFPIGTYVKEINGDAAILSESAKLDGTLVGVTGGGNGLLAGVGIDPNTYFVGGYEVSNPSTKWITIEKSRDYEVVSNSSVQATYGNYILVGDLFGVPALGFRALVELRRGSQTTRGVKNSRVIGMARVQGLEYVSGVETNNNASCTAVYKLFLSEITLTPGNTMDEVGSITSPGALGTNTAISANVLTAYGVTNVLAASTVPFAKGDPLIGSGPSQKAIVYYWNPASQTVYTKRGSASFVSFTGTTTGASAIISGVSAAAAINLSVGMYIAGATVATDTEAIGSAWITALTLQADGTYQVTVNRNPTISATPANYVALYNINRTFFGTITGAGTTVALQGNTSVLSGSILPPGTYVQGSSIYTTQTVNPILTEGTYISSTTATTVTFNQNVGVAGAHTFAFFTNMGLTALDKDSMVIVKPTNLVTASAASAATTIKIIAGLQDVSVGMAITGTNVPANAYITAINNAIGGSTITISAGLTGAIQSLSVLTATNNSQTVNNSAVITTKNTIFESADPTILFELPHKAIRNNVGADGTSPPPTTVAMRREQFINVPDASSSVTFSLTNPDETLPATIDSKYFYAYYTSHSTASLIGTIIPASSISLLSGTSGSVALTSGTGVKIGVVYNVNKSKLATRIKTLQTGASALKIANINPANRSKIYLSVPDVTKVVGVWDSNVFAGSATDVSSLVTYNVTNKRWETTTCENITNNFTLDDGQRDDHYEMATISLKPSAPQPQGKLIVVVEYFTATQGDYFDADSYATMSSIFGADYYRNIPTFTDTAGNEHILQNCFDFRQYMSGNSNIFFGNWVAGQNKISIQSPNTASGFAVGDTVSAQGIPDGARVHSIAGNVLTLTSSYPTLTAANATTTESLQCFSVIATIDAAATANGYRSGYSYSSDMIINKSNIISSYSHYLPRIDKVILNQNGKFNVIKGVSSKNPSSPVVAETSFKMTLFDLIIPEYTYDAKSIHVAKKFQRGYTMKDIGGIETRLKNLEESVALSLLEQDTESMIIQDSSGLNRFKSGFVVDNFRTPKLGDFNNPEYNVAIDKDLGHCRPAAEVSTIDFGLDTGNVEGQNFVILDGLAMLPFTEVSAASQLSASSFISVNPFAVYTWNGTIKLDPSIDTWIDYTYLPDIVNTINIVQNRVVGTVPAPRLLANTLSGPIYTYGFNSAFGPGAGFRGV